MQTRESAWASRYLASWKPRQQTGLNKTKHIFTVSYTKLHNSILIERKVALLKD